MSLSHPIVNDILKRSDDKDNHREMNFISQGMVMIMMMNIYTT